MFLCQVGDNSSVQSVIRRPLNCCLFMVDVDTRRRAACDLVRALCKSFEAPVIQIFSSYVQHMLQVFLCAVAYRHITYGILQHNCWALLSCLKSVWFHVGIVFYSTGN